jgi:arsenite-transporting ATPase
VDTASTGHTLLLLDVTGAFHRQVMKDAGIDPKRITTPLMRLQNPGLSRVVLVTLAETTPVAEAIELQDELRRAGIEPFGWVVNAVLVGTNTSDRVLRARARLQVPQLTKISNVARHVWIAKFDPALVERNACPPGTGASPSALRCTQSAAAP